MILFSAQYLLTARKGLRLPQLSRFLLCSCSGNAIEDWIKLPWFIRFVNEYVNGFNLKGKAVKQYENCKTRQKLSLR